MPHNGCGSATKGASTYRCCALFHTLVEPKSYRACLRELPTPCPAPPSIITALRITAGLHLSGSKFAPCRTATHINRRRCPSNGPHRLREATKPPTTPTAVQTCSIKESGSFCRGGVCGTKPEFFGVGHRAVHAKHAILGVGIKQTLRVSLPRRVPNRTQLSGLSPLCRSMANRKTVNCKRTGLVNTGPVRWALCGLEAPRTSIVADVVGAVFFKFPCAPKRYKGKWVAKDTSKS